MKSFKEYISELSKDTMARYTRHASRDVAGHSFFQGHYAGTKTLLPGDDPSKTRGILRRRQKGIDLAVKKLAKEETEVNELSDDTLKSYTDKARTHLRKSIFPGQISHKQLKRGQGIARAAVRRGGDGPTGPGLMQTKYGVKRYNKE